MRLEVTRKAGLAVRALAALAPPGNRVKAGELALQLCEALQNWQPELARLREPLYREVADLVLDTDGLSAAEAASRLGLQLAQHWTIEGVAA